MCYVYTTVIMLCYLIKPEKNLISETYLAPTVLDKDYELVIEAVLSLHSSLVTEIKS